MAVELEQPAPADRRHAVAGADLHLPHDSQSNLGPGRDDPFLRRDAGALWSQETGPVTAGLPGAEVADVAGAGGLPLFLWVLGLGRRRAAASNGDYAENGVQEAHGNLSTLWGWNSARMH